MARPCIEPRLLNRDQAAEYVGFSRAAFDRHCSVTPISFGDERLTRWDRLDLDAWVDALKGRRTGSVPVQTSEDMARSLEDWDG